MIILGLTGSIAMGKSTTAALLRRLGLPVHDADAAVHALTGRGGAAVDAVGRAFPGTVRKGAVDRAALGRKVLGDPAALKRLEAILHPLVRASERRFLAGHARRRTPLVVLDIPLLFETGGERRCDAVLAVHCRPALQRRRALARPGMDPARFEATLARQMPAREKVKRADFAVDTGLGRARVLRELQAIVKLLGTWEERAWAPDRSARPGRNRRRR